ncbi:leucine--tRNA ligase, mitochondrial isoform X2 [Malaya genurostris]|uniref:leucine--tRNA ligase, mitochondrial isoform X2 n=1 Tax=Malaya genurostris TaxID=325434 RepID=UPI0026F3A9BE|nr:leucine--tRNA ligase, mitochondrial isoform X2 [Malaya genurostris]
MSLLRVGVLQSIPLRTAKSDIRWLRKFSSSSASTLNTRDLTSAMKLEIEKKWHNNLGDYRFDTTSPKPKRYVLSMFPYPSGNLHMGHVRVYTISDAMARFYRMNGDNVLHPMGWDAFGLPAENAAIQRHIPADRWTKQNIQQMRDQFLKLQFSFDWERELATCDPEYYRWTQKLFLMLYNDGLAYQKEALVNWDPVDETVLADEQVDDNGCSWRSGAKVEKKILRQWFIKTTKFAKSLYDGLSDSILKDWKDIIKLQKHWIGECDGYVFDLKIIGENGVIPLWVSNPQLLREALFVAVNPTNLLNRSNAKEQKMNIKLEHPVTGKPIPVIVTEQVIYPEGNDFYLGVASVDGDRQLASIHQCPVEHITDIDSENASRIESQCYSSSSKLRDWLISRQRFWGTPIPIIHCPSCGTVPVPESQLPVELPLDSVGIPLSQNTGWMKTTCPNCQSEEATRETDTMDTFVDSSWYFLRFLDPKNQQSPFNENYSHQFMPVDLYVGGKEHAVLHMYYARFMNHYLYSKGLVPSPEPFKRLLIQGMVMGRSFRLKESGKYLPVDQVTIVDEKKNKAIETSTGLPVVTLWEKMSKSKLNGVDPLDVLKEHGCDTLRLILLGDVAPTSHRNWSEATFPGILNWLRRIWMTMYDYRLHRTDIPLDHSASFSDEFHEQDSKLWDSRNYFVAGATFNYKHSHQLSVGISKMQGLTNAIRRSSPEVVAFSRQYERAIAAQIIMLAPMAPHFASELWEQFLALPHRLNPSSDEINWEGGLFEQNWPVVDEDYALDLTFKVNGYECCILKIPTKELNLLSHQQSLDLAFQQQAVLKYIGQRKVSGTEFVLYPSCDAILSINLEQGTKAKDEEPQEGPVLKNGKKDKKKKKKLKRAAEQ